MTNRVAKQPIPGRSLDDRRSRSTHPRHRRSPKEEFTAAVVPVTDTLFADVSEYQSVVDDSYPYEVLSIRVSDGTYQDHNFAANYAWMRKALDDGKLVFGIVYTYCRPNWQANANTVRSMIDANGGLHPRVALMLDVEQGGNPTGDGSSWINKLYWNLADYAGNPARIIGYGNIYDLTAMWRTKPNGLRLIIASYGNNPPYPGKVAHQYTDGSGYGGGLPEGAPPFGNCFSGETKFLTKGGTRTLRETAGTSQMVLGYRGEWVPAEIKSFGEQELLEVVLTRYGREKVVRATAGHRWFKRNERSRIKTPVTTVDLAPGDQLQDVFRVNHSQKVKPSTVGIQAGFVFGDGYAEVQGSRVKLHGEKDSEMLKWFPLSPARGGTLESGVAWTEVRDLPRYFKSAPPLDESMSYLYGWLAGYFAADGTVVENIGAQLCSTSLGNVECARNVCHLLGIRTTGIREEVRDTQFKKASTLYRLHLNAKDLREDFFLIESHRQRAASMSARWETRKNKFSSWTVKSVKPAGTVEEVFCAVVPDGHAFALEDNILTGNCDMNSADGLNPVQFAAACGIAAGPTPDTELV